MSAYYNENEPTAVAWLRELMAEGLIAPGDIDDRSVKDVKPTELRNYTQLHFFAGVGCWSYALRQAGWPDERPIVSASCPCQSLSCAGQQKGHDDERHLWPTLYEILAVICPPVIVGEQVASSLGREWLTGVRLDLEELGFAVGAADLCSASLAFDLDLTENLEVFRDGVATPARRPLAPAETVQLATRVIELLFGRKPQIVVSAHAGGTKMNVHTISADEIALLTIANEICYPISMANGRRVRVYPYREGV